MEHLERYVTARDRLRRAHCHAEIVIAIALATVGLAGILAAWSPRDERLRELVAMSSTTAGLAVADELLESVATA